MRQRAAAAVTPERHESSLMRNLRLHVSIAGPAAPLASSAFDNMRNATLAR
jgi:hypothetical protein